MTFALFWMLNIINQFFGDCRLTRVRQPQFTTRNKSVKFLMFSTAAAIYLNYVLYVAEDEEDEDEEDEDGEEGNLGM